MKRKIFDQTTLFLAIVLPLLLAIMLMTTSGCDTTKADRIALAERAITNLQRISTDLGLAETTIKESLTSAHALSEDTTLLSEEQKQKLTELISSLQEKYETVLTYKESVDKDLQELKLATEEAKTSDGGEVSLIGSAIGAAAKYAPTPVGEILTIISTALLAWGGYKKRQQYLNTPVPRDTQYKLALANAIENARDGLSEAEYEKFSAELYKSMDLMTYKEYLETIGLSPADVQVKKEPIS